jgi:anti-sigma B factor antagonist
MSLESGRRIRYDSGGYHSLEPGSNTMSDQAAPYAQCSLVVVRVTHSQVMGDTVADGLRDELLALYEQSGATHIVLDLEAVAYLSSAGIRPLLSLNKKVREREGRLLLCRLREDVHGVLLATRLISSHSSAPATFESHPDVPSSVASLYQ